MYILDYWISPSPSPLVRVRVRTCARVHACVHVCVCAHMCARLPPARHASARGAVTIPLQKWGCARRCMIVLSPKMNDTSSTHHHGAYNMWMILLCAMNALGAGLAFYFALAMYTEHNG